MSGNGKRNYEESWKLIDEFCFVNELKIHEYYTRTEPCVTLNNESQKYIENLIGNLTEAMNSMDPREFARIVDAACSIFPYSSKLRNFVENTYKDSSSELGYYARSHLNRVKNLKSDNYRISLAELFAEIENTDVDLLKSATFHGVEVWPAMRAALATVVENKILATGRLASKLEEDVDGTLYEIEKAFSSNVEYRPPSINFIDKLPGFKDGNLNIEFLFFTRTRRYIKKRDGYWVDGPSDYLHQILSENYDCLKIEEYTGQTTLRRQPRLLSPTYFRTPWNNNKKKYLADMKSATPDWKGPEEAKSWKLFCLSSKILGLKIDPKLYLSIFKNLNYISGYAIFFQDFLKIINPKYVFQEIYYSPESAGLILACKSMKIPVIEVQHGLIGTHQWQSTHWLNMPKNGYLLHPDYFWVFDQFEKENTELSQSNLEYKRPSIAAGHAEICLHTRKGKRAPKAVNPSTSQFLNELEDGKYNILFSLQYYSADFSPILNIAQNFPENVRILVRLHPMQMPLLENIKGLIDDYGINNIEVEYSTRAYLYDVLERSHHVITNYSTLAREGLEFDCDVSLVHTMGRQLYSQFVELGRMAFCKDVDDITSRVREAHISFRDPLRWKQKVAEFRHFKNTYLLNTPENAIDQLRSDNTAKRNLREAVASKLHATEMFSKPLEIGGCDPTNSVINVERSHGEYNRRNIFYIDPNLEINRGNLSKIFLLTISKTADDAAIDIVFSNLKTAASKLEVLSLFYGMSRRAINVHIDDINTSDHLINRQDYVQISQADLDDIVTHSGFLTSPTSIAVVKASDEVLVQARSWLRFKGLKSPITVLTFSENLTSDQVRCVLKSTRLSDIGSQQSLILNGSKHFGVDGVSVRLEQFQVFEPAVYSFDAAVAICEIADKNLVISDHGSEFIFANAGRNYESWTFEGWMS